MIVLFDVKYVWLFETLIGYQLNNLGVNIIILAQVSVRPQVSFFDIRSCAKIFLGGIISLTRRTEG